MTLLDQKKCFPAQEGRISASRIYDDWQFPEADILPVLNIGDHAMHIPYHVTWGHEKIEKVLSMTISDSLTE